MGRMQGDQTHMGLRQSGDMEGSAARRAHGLDTPKLIGAVSGAVRPAQLRDERGGIAGARAHVWCDRVHAGGLERKGHAEREATVCQAGGAPTWGDNHLAGGGGSMSTFGGGV